MYSDITGYAPEWVKNVTIGLMVIGTLAVLTIVSAGTLTAAGTALAGSLVGSGVGGLTGILAAATTGSLISATIGGIAGGIISNSSGDDFLNGFGNGFKTGAITGAFAGGLGSIASSGASSHWVMQGFLNGTISTGITAFQIGINVAFTPESLLISFAFGMIGGSIGANLAGAKAAITGFGLSIAEAGVGVVIDIYGTLCSRVAQSYCNCY